MTSPTLMVSKMKPSEKLKQLGFVQVLNNMGTIVWQHVLSEQFTEVIEFNSHFNQYATYVKSGKNITKLMLLNYDLHKIIDEYIAKELYWKWRKT